MSSILNPCSLNNFHHTPADLPNKRTFYRIRYVVRSLVLVACVLLITPVNAAKDLRSITLRGGSDIGSLSALQDLSLAYKLQNQFLSFSFIESTAPDTIEKMMEGNLDFGVAIQGWDQAVAEGNPNLNLIPLILTGLCPTYKLNLGVVAPAIIFSREVLVRMYTGSITRWNDELIQRENPLIKLPDMNITMVIERGTAAKNFIMKNTLYQFNATAMAESSMKLDNHMDFPLDRYASYVLVDVAANTLVTSVIATNGTFGMAFHTTSVALGVSIGRMINKAGSVVSISSQSLNFAAIELATKQPLTHTSAQVLTDALGPATWPWTLSSYLILDTHESHGSCKARELLVEFFLYLYTSDQAKSIITSRGYVPIPSLLLDQSGAIELLRTQVECRGSSALPVKITSIRTIGVPSMISFVATLLNSVYHDDTAQWEIQSGTDNTAVSRLVNSEIDVALINPDNVDTASWKLLTESGDFLALPFAGLAVTWAFNPHLTSEINLAQSSKPLVLDEGAFSELFGSCLNNWNSPSILTLNPWISAVTHNASIPMQMLMGCGPLDNSDNVPLGLFMLKEAKRYAEDPRNAESEGVACMKRFASDISSDAMLMWRNCQSMPEYGIQFTPNEAIVPSLISGTVAGIGISVADNDYTKLFPEVRVTRNGVTQNTRSDVDGVLACAYDTFDVESLSFDFKRSQNASCFPTTEQIHLVVRRRYYSNPAVTNSSSCLRGKDSLEFFNWLLIDQQIDKISSQVNLARLSLVPGVSAAYTVALNSILCDDEPLFITLPTIWSVNSALFGFGNAAAGLGIVFTLVLLGFVAFFRNHPVMRASSPPFVIISLIGILLLFVAVIAVVQPVSPQSCDMLSWTANLGMTLTFSPIAAKTFRVWRIFARRKLAVVKIPNQELLIGVAGAVSILLVLMGLWQAFSPLMPHTSTTVEGAQSVVHMYTLCSSRDIGTVWFAIICAYHGAMIFFSALMAFSTRRVAGPFNESSVQALAIYNVTFVLVIIGSLLGLLDFNGDSIIALLVFVALWISFFTAALLVVPKVLLVVANHDVRRQSIADNTETSGGFTFLSVDNFDTVSIVLSYIVALRRQLEKADVKLTELRKSSGSQQKLNIQVAPMASPSLRAVSLVAARDGVPTRRLAANAPISNPSVNSGLKGGNSVNVMMSQSRRDVPET